ncbi:MAG: type II toxin-antitoxin system VapC family toxin [Rhodanobacteraceae bacterium]
MILADTSVWIDHLHGANHTLQDLLQANEVACHPCVIGELACGSLAKRREVLAVLAQLPQVPQASHAETLWLLDHHHCYGRGIGWVDTHLLASTALALETQIWSRDKRLMAVATELGLAWPATEP